MARRGRVRLVLLHPPLRNIVPAAVPEYVEHNRGHTPPVGLLYIQAAVEQSCHESVFLDANLEGWDHEEAARQALAHEPDVIGLQAMSFTLPDAYRVAKAVKDLAPGTAVMVGGPHATIFPEETAALPAVDYAFAGEGEVGIVQFLEAFGDLEAVAAVPGVACKADGRVRYTPMQGLLEDLDAVAFPARRSSPYQRYSSILAERNPITILISSRGCPFRCIFCNRMGRTYRWHSADYVLRELESILELGIPEIFIHDDTFTIRRERVAAICRGIIERGYDLIWEARTRVDCVDQELIALMRRAGCHRLSFGVESGSPRVLDNLRKGIDLEQVEQVFAWCRREGIITLADFMVGNPGERQEDIDMTLDLARKIDPDFIQYSVCSLYPGTPLYDAALEKGLLHGDPWRDFAQDPLKAFRSPAWTEHFSEDEIRRISSAAYRAFYLRPKFILKQLRRVNSCAQFARMARAALGMLRR